MSHHVRTPSTISMTTDDPVIQEACRKSFHDLNQMVELMGKKYICMNYMGGGNEFVLREIFIVKPSKPEIPEWHGGGSPPPVGTECEFIKHNSPPAPKGQWKAGKILYLSECTIVIGVEGGERVHHPRNCSYRPIRTPEQIAAEERTRQVNVMADIAAPLINRYEVAERLYDAGYRKFEIVEGEE